MVKFADLTRALNYGSSYKNYCFDRGRAKYVCETTTWRPGPTDTGRIAKNKYILFSTFQIYGKSDHLFQLLFRIFHGFNALFRYFQTSSLKVVIDRDRRFLLFLQYG